MSRWSSIELTSRANQSGRLVVADFARDIPFVPKRTFWVTDVPAGITRGFHAHKTGHQLLVCLSGRVLATLDDGEKLETIVLTNSGPAVWMPNMVWGEQTFLEPNTILLVIASNEYDENDYIRDRSQFASMIQDL